MDDPAVSGDEATRCSLALWNLVIRPPRATYQAWQLGPADFMVGGVRAVRRDTQLKAKTGGFLACSHYFPWKDWETEPLRKCPVIVYLHGNSSNRLEAGGILGPLLAQGISLFCFDFAGCGISDGEYISLGWHERDDLATVLEHLRQSPFCGPIGLWGRSMGAATVLLHADRDQSLGAICLDSAFVSLRRLVEDLATSTHAVCALPYCLVVLALAIIRMRVQTLADFDIEDVVPLEHAKRSYVPAIFMHGQEDTFISPGHSRQLYDAYLGDKEFVLIEGDHNTERTTRAIDRAVNFFHRAFRLDEVDLGIAHHAAGTSAAAGGPQQRSVTPPPQLRRVAAPAAPPPPTPPPKQMLAAINPTVQPKVEGDKDVLRIEFSDDWQAVMEEMLSEIGWASRDSRSRLAVKDKAGKPVNLFSDVRGKVPPRDRFPLSIERQPHSSPAKAACGGG